MGTVAAEPNTATIVDSGSTNRAGFRIVVNQSGSAEMTSAPRRFGAPQQQAQPVRRTIPTALAERFFADLTAAKPLASLPGVHCMKSASFGSSMTIALGADQTPDLNCGDGGNPAIANLIRDAHEIVALFHE
jgi:hypothetical protein